MCWLPIDQPLLLPGDSTCGARRPSPCSVAQLLASRLRRIGDQLEKGWAGGEADGGRGGGGPGDGRPRTAAAAAAGTGGGHLRGFLRTAIRLTVLVLLVARRHL